MFTKMKDKWENWEKKDDAVEFAKNFCKGYSLCASVGLSCMFVIATVTGKKWALVKIDE